MAEPLNEPFSVVPRDELADDPVRLVKTLEAVEIEALLLERAHEGLDDAAALGSPTYDGVIVIPSHFTSWLASAPCPSCPASLAAVIVVQTVSKETGSDLQPQPDSTPKCENMWRSKTRDS
jgi:hypothetical protein